MPKRLALILGATLAVAGCQRSGDADLVQVMDVPPVSVQGDTGAAVDPSDPTLRDGPGTLLDREPDTCGAAALQVYLQQPASALPLSDQPLRIIGPTSIVTQDYIPNRVNAYTDAEGRIQRISCG